MLAHSRPVASLEFCEKFPTGLVEHCKVIEEVLSCEILITFCSDRTGRPTSRTFAENQFNRLLYNAAKNGNVKSPQLSTIIFSHNICLSISRPTTSSGWDTYNHHHRPLTFQYSTAATKICICVMDSCWKSVLVAAAAALSPSSVRHLSLTTTHAMCALGCLSPDPEGYLSIYYYQRKEYIEHWSSAKACLFATKS